MRGVPFVFYQDFRLQYLETSLSIMIHGGPDWTLLASGAADGTILIWAVNRPPQLAYPDTDWRRGTGGSQRKSSLLSGSNFSSSLQPSTANSSPFNYSLVHRIERANHPSATCIGPLHVRRHICCLICRRLSAHPLYPDW